MPIGALLGAVTGGISAVRSIRNSFRRGNRREAAADSLAALTGGGPTAPPVPTPGQIPIPFSPPSGTPVNTGVPPAAYPFGPPGPVTFGNTFDNNPATPGVGSFFNSLNPLVDQSARLQLARAQEQAAAAAVQNAPPEISATQSGPTIMPSASVVGGSCGPLGLASLLQGNSRRGRRAAIEMLVASGAFNGIACAPIVYRSNDGRTKYGSNPGYVLIRKQSGNSPFIVQMPREIARSLGLWRPRRKPVISVRDSNAIRRANSARKRLQRVSKNAGLYCRTSAPRRSTSTTTRRRR